MVQKKKSSESSTMKRKSSTSSTGKRKLGDTSLDWITDTTESEAIILEQAENDHCKSTGDSREKKIGVIKQYSYEEAEKKKDETPEATPTISGSSSTIIKGKKVMPAKKEEAQKAEFKEEEKPTTMKETPSVPVDSVEITSEKIDSIPSGEMDKESDTKPEVKTGELKESEEKDKEKTISVGKTPVEIGKTYKITEENELILADEEEKTISDKKGDISNNKKIPPEYEVKKEDVTIKEEISKEPSIPIPDDSSSIVKKRKKTAAKEEKIKEEEKPPAEKKEIAAAAAKEEVPPSAKRKWMRMSVAGESLKKVGKKLSGAVAKPFKLDKTKLKKSVNHVINVSKKPVKAISAADRKITQSVKKIIMSGDHGVAAKSILNNIKSTDAQITKSAKKLIDSVLD